MHHVLSGFVPRKAFAAALLPMGALMMSAPAAIIAAPVAGGELSSDAAEAQPHSGKLMMHGLTSTYAMPAVRLASDMDVTVTGNVARVKVTQVFRNTSKEWMEATYLYPLPTDAAVDDLKMVVGQRVIIGRIKKREEARGIYETAKEEGKKAGLVEQQRPNMFTNSVANIGPGETVLVAIEYQMPLRQVAGTFSLRLPLVVGPRYVPPHSVTSGKSATDAAKVTSAPVLDPRLGKDINPVSITVNLSPGFVPANVASAYHDISVIGDGTTRTVKLAADEVPANRDFELSWRSASADPVVALYKEKLDGKSYIMASITPPMSDKIAKVPPREMIFVIDNSGSMHGTSIMEAKASLAYALGTLRPQDHFNIIRFDDTMTQLYRQSVPASAAKIAEAQKYAKGLEAEGGTEMLPALRAALNDTGVTKRGKTVRQVIFLTDGALSNEQEMLATIAQDKGNSRVFMVGIGSAPNNYLMSRMATTGRGVYTNIGNGDEVAFKMQRLLDMLSRPAVQDVKVTVTGNSFDLTPKILPDLYAGEPLVLLGQADRDGGTVTVSGNINGRLWKQSVDLTKALPSPAVAKLWARTRIDDIEAEMTLGKIDYEDADMRIADLGLAFSLVTRMTSLVAVDETPSRPKGTPLRKEDLPINLPAGWDFDYLFGGATAKAAMDNEIALAARDAEQIDLPQTAANYMAMVMQGLLALLLGLAGLLFLRRRNRKLG